MQHEKLRYQPNKKSQLLIMAGMIFLVYALFKVINVYRYTSRSTDGIILPDIFVGVEILITIFVMLLSFLLGEKFKTYDKNWLFVGVTLTIYPLFKIFIFPINLYKKFNELIEEGQLVKYDPDRWLVTVIISLVLSSALYFAGTLLSYIKNKQLVKYYKEAGLEHGE